MMAHTTEIAASNLHQQLDSKAPGSIAYSITLKLTVDDSKLNLYHFQGHTNLALHRLYSTKVLIHAYNSRDFSTPMHLHAHALDRMIDALS